MFKSNGATANAFGYGKGRYNQNNFGGTVSGPIRKNKTFFFATYEGTQTRDFSPGNYTTLPELPWRTGDFSDQLGAQEGTDALGRPVYSGELFDPATTRTVNGQLVRDPFTFGGKLNVIDASRFSIVSKNILPLIPDPILSGVINNYILISGAGRSHMNQYSGKVDHRFNEKHRASGYYLWGKRPYDIAYAGGFFKDLNSPLNRHHTEEDTEFLVRASEDGTITPTILNHIGYGFNSIATPQFPISNAQGWPQKIGLTGGRRARTLANHQCDRQGTQTKKPKELGLNVHGSRPPHTHGSVGGGQSTPPSASSEAHCQMLISSQPALASQIATDNGTQRTPFVLAGKSAGKKQKYASATNTSICLLPGGDRTELEAGAAALLTASGLGRRINRDPF